MQRLSSSSRCVSQSSLSISTIGCCASIVRPPLASGVPQQYTQPQYMTCKRQTSEKKIRRKVRRIIKFPREEIDEMRCTNVSIEVGGAVDCSGKNTIGVECSSGDDILSNSASPTPTSVQPASPTPTTVQPDSTNYTSSTESTMYNGPHMISNTITPNTRVISIWAKGYREVLKLAMLCDTYPILRSLLVVPYKPLLSSSCWYRPLPLQISLATLVRGAFHTPEVPDTASLHNTPDQSCGSNTKPVASQTQSQRPHIHRGDKEKEAAMFFAIKWIRTGAIQTALVLQAVADRRYREQQQHQMKINSKKKVLCSRPLTPVSSADMTINLDYFHNRVGREGPNCSVDIPENIVAATAYSSTAVDMGVVEGPVVCGVINEEKYRSMSINNSNGKNVQEVSGRTKDSNSITNGDHTKGDPDDAWGFLLVNRNELIRRFKIINSGVGLCDQQHLDGLVLLTHPVSISNDDFSRSVCVVSGEMTVTAKQDTIKSHSSRGRVESVVPCHNNLEESQMSTASRNKVSIVEENKIISNESDLKRTTVFTIDEVVYVYNINAYAMTPDHNVKLGGGQVPETTVEGEGAVKKTATVENESAKSCYEMPPRYSTNLTRMTADTLLCSSAAVKQCLEKIDIKMQRNLTMKKKGINANYRLTPEEREALLRRHLGQLPLYIGGYNSKRKKPSDLTEKGVGAPAEGNKKREKKRKRKGRKKSSFFENDDDVDTVIVHTNHTVQYVHTMMSSVIGGDDETTSKNNADERRAEDQEREKRCKGEEIKHEEFSYRSLPISNLNYNNNKAKPYYILPLNKVLQLPLSVGRSLNSGNCRIIHGYQKIVRRQRTISISHSRSSTVSTVGDVGNVTLSNSAVYQNRANREQNGDDKEKEEEEEVYFVTSYNGKLLPAIFGAADLLSSPSQTPTYTSGSSEWERSKGDTYNNTTAVNKKHTTESTASCRFIPMKPNVSIDIDESDAWTVGMQHLGLGTLSEGIPPLSPRERALLRTYRHELFARR